MTEHNLFYYPSASFTNAQRPLLKVAALYSDKLLLVDPVGASRDTVGADHIAVKQCGCSMERVVKARLL